MSSTQLLLRISSQPGNVPVIRDGLLIGQHGHGHDIELSGEDVLDLHARVQFQDGHFVLVAESPKHPFVTTSNGQTVTATEVAMEEGVSFEIGGVRFDCLARERKEDEDRTENGVSVLSAIFRDFDNGLQPFFKEKVYRIGVIGGKGSGKTCLLTALGMSRRPHPKGLTCTQLGKLDPEAEGLQHISAEKKQKLILEFQGGYQRIKESADMMLEGKLPQKTPLEVLRMVYFLGGRAGQPEAKIELIDYAGEFIEEEGVYEEIPSSRKLFNILQEVDAFIILAETPEKNSGAENDPVFDKDHMEALHQIKKVFLQLHMDRTRPVAILLNKWDRHRELEQTTLEQEIEALNSYVKTNAGEILLDLKNTIQGITRGPVSLLPVSAFGKSEIVPLDNGNLKIERPVFGKNHLLPSFGIEDTLDTLMTQIREGYKQELLKKLESWEAKLQALPSPLKTEQEHLHATRLKSDVEGFQKELKGHIGMEEMLPEVVSRIQKLLDSIANRLQDCERWSATLRKVQRYAAIFLVAFLLSLLAGGFLKDRAYVRPMRQARTVLQESLSAATSFAFTDELEKAIVRFQRSPSFFVRIWPWPGSPVSGNGKIILLERLQNEVLNQVRDQIARDPLSGENQKQIQDYRRLLTRSGIEDHDLQLYWWEQLVSSTRLLKVNPELNQQHLDRVQAIIQNHFPGSAGDERMLDLIKELQRIISTKEQNHELIAAWGEYLSSLDELNFRGAETHVSVLIERRSALSDTHLRDLIRQQLRATLLGTVNQALQTHDFERRSGELSVLRERFHDVSNWQWLYEDFGHAISLLQRAQRDFVSYNVFRGNPSHTAADRYLQHPHPLFMRRLLNDWKNGEFHAMLQVKVDHSGPILDSYKFTATLQMDGSEIISIDRPNSWHNGSRRIIMRDSENLAFQFIVRTETQHGFWQGGWIRTLRDPIIRNFTSRPFEVSGRDFRQGGERQIRHEGIVVRLRITDIQHDSRRNQPPPWWGQYLDFQGNVAQ